VHAAADTEYDWGWYGRLVGGYFYDHPGIYDSFHNVQEGVFNVVDPNNNATKHLPKQWKRSDEFYSFKKLSTDTKVLLTLDEGSYQGGKKMGQPSYGLGTMIMTEEGLSIQPLAIQKNPIRSLCSYNIF
jgi:hypothetical protein